MKRTLMAALAPLLLPGLVAAVALASPAAGADVEPWRFDACLTVEGQESGLYSRGSFDEGIAAEVMEGRAEVVGAGASCDRQRKPTVAVPQDGLVDVGQAITLTLNIGGSPFLRLVEWPDLEANPELASNFSIPPERSAPIVENGVKVFTQTLRANDSDVTRIPPIELSYFDPGRGHYAVARTQPIALEVAETKTLTSLSWNGQEITI